MKYTTSKASNPHAITIDDIRNLRALLDFAPRLEQADTVELKAVRHCPRDQILLMDPNDPFMLGSGGSEIWIACHPSREIEARKMFGPLLADHDPQEEADDGN